MDLSNLNPMKRKIKRQKGPRKRKGLEKGRPKRLLPMITFLVWRVQFDRLTRLWPMTKTMKIISKGIM